MTLPSCHPSPAPSHLIRISILSAGSVGRVFHCHLPHQCPRDARPICGVWIAGGRWAGWSTGSTAEVTGFSRPAAATSLPLAHSLTCLLSHHCPSPPCGLLTQMRRPDFLSPSVAGACRGGGRRGLPGNRAHWELGTGLASASILWVRSWDSRRDCGSS